MTKEIKHPIVLALYPNHNGFGYALFDGPTDPLDCGQMKIRPICNSQSLKRIKACITLLKPEMIIVQETEGSNSWKSKRVKSLLQNVISYAKSIRLKVKAYTREQIQAVFSQFQSETKYEIAKTIAKWHPSYKNKLPQPRKFYMSEAYMMGMFDAMSLALTHFYLS
ncbi:MAG: hypothetical protein POELPBGB_02943 [Bacteroidia bacterium]|nr:hypothetical protein [Bacteroidia bacterium]